MHIEDSTGARGNDGQGDACAQCDVVKRIEKNRCAYRGVRGGSFNYNATPLRATGHLLDPIADTPKKKRQGGFRRTRQVPLYSRLY